MNDALIYDVGMNDGQDSAFYMHKGYRVVAVEANPILCEQARQQFSEQIRSGQLTIVDVAVSDAEGELDFYVNLENDDWSSLDPVWGTRDGTRFEKIKVRAVPFSRILEEHGIPCYLKIDIEGADLTVMQQLRSVDKKPKFISVEENKIEYFPLLWSLGYRGFKIVNQERIPLQQYDGWSFKPGSSGPFGDEALGQWLPFGDAIVDYMLNVRDCRGRGVATSGWFDIHATLETPSLAKDQPYPQQWPQAQRKEVHGIEGATFPKPTETPSSIQEAVDPSVERAPGFVLPTTSFSLNSLWRSSGLYRRLFRRRDTR